MSIDWSKVAPVLLSIGVIILVALLRQYSKTIAAIAATMPINIPLGLWIVVGGTDASTRQDTLVSFSQTLTINIFPTVGFLIAAWLAARSGMGLVPSLVVGYIVWAIGLGAILLVRAVLGN